MTVVESVRVMKPRTKRPRPASREGYGIVNPYGDIWTTDLFDTEAAAWAHVRDFWRDQPALVDKFRVAKVRQRISFVSELPPAPSSGL